MAVSRVLKNVGALGIAAAAVLGLSYCSEVPKYKFAEMASKGSETIPGSRLISSFKSGDLTSPVSWFWPATTTWVYARPEPTIPNRFYIMSMVYKEAPAVLLVDTDCAHRTEYRYAQDGPESADPARDAFGQPVVAPNGKTFRHFESTTAPSPAELHALCDTDWTAERKAAAAPRS
jgi:hypothetical protein